MTFSMDLAKDLSKQEVLIFGLGVSGLGALRFLSSRAKKVYVVNKGAPKTWKDSKEAFELAGEENCFSQEDKEALSLVKGVDLIILSPGIPRDIDFLKGTKAPLYNEVELAFQFCPYPIIAVTGTNGKTTTVSLLDHLLKSLGKKVFTGGNIGRAFCSWAQFQEEVDYILLELSSFQLESMERFRRTVGVLLNIFPNHGERYNEYKDYAKAKFNLSQNMKKGDTLIFDGSHQMIRNWGESFIGNKVSLDPKETEALKREFGSKIEVGRFKLPGDHNKLNLRFALEVLKSLDLLKGNEEKIGEALSHFKGIPHRIEYVESKENFRVYNDAKSTNWDAVKTAVSSFSGEELVLILGGKKRGHNDSIPEDVIELLKKRVSKVLLIGESSSLLESQLRGEVDFTCVETLERAVEETRRGPFKGVLLLSPGFPSFDQFKNYEERGDFYKSHFKE